MDKRYKVIFSNLHKKKDYFKDRMLTLGVSWDVAEEIIKKAPVILKKDLSLKDARTYADAVLEAGGKVTIQVENEGENRDEKASLSTTLSLKNFIMCPQCGHKQIKTRACVKCGFCLETSNDNM